MDFSGRVKKKRARDLHGPLVKAVVVAVYTRTHLVRPVIRVA
jgi:hypothetical protein